MASDTDSEAPSSPKKGLAARLQSAAEADQQAVESYRKQIEASTQQQLSALATNTREQWQRELNVIENAMAVDAKRVASMTSRLWKHLLLYAAIVSTALFLGLWGPMQWHLHQLEQLQLEREQIRSQIAGYSAAIKVLKRKTAGVIVMRNKSGKLWLVTPKQCQPSRPCLQLPDDFDSN